MDAILENGHGDVVRSLNGLCDACSGLAALRRRVSSELRAAERNEDKERAVDLREFRDRLSQATEGLVRAITKVPEECWTAWFEQPGTVGGAELRSRVEAELQGACAEV